MGPVAHGALGAGTARAVVSHLNGSLQLVSGDQPLQRDLVKVPHWRPDNKGKLLNTG